MAVVELVLAEGESLDPKGERILLGETQLTALRREGHVSASLLNKAEKCGPLLCVLAAGVLITVFRATRRVSQTR